MGCMSETTVTKNDQQSRYEAHLDGELAGFAEFRRERDVVVMPHTEVFAAFGGRGVGSALARFASTTLLPKVWRCVRPARSSRVGWTSIPTIR